MKQKCVTADKEENIKIISLLPKSWLRKKISQEFHFSERLVKLTRDLVKIQGILPDLKKKESNNEIGDNTLQKVEKF